MKIDTSRAAILELKRDLEFTANLRGHCLSFQTTWGLFSPREVDEGSAMLLDYILSQPTDRVLDLGCGYGAVGLALAADCPHGQVVMVDKDFVAVDYAAKNAHANGLTNATALLSNGLSHVKEDYFDLAVSNLPAKSGKELYFIMFQDVYDHLADNGRFYIVTITGLRRFVRRAFEDIFGNYEKIKQGPKYTVAMAYKAPGE